MGFIHVLAAIFAAFCWGLSFVVIEIGLESMPPLLFSALRFALAAFPAIFFVPRNGLAWKWIISIGFCLGVVMFGLLFVGMSMGMSAALSSLIVQTHVIFTLILTSIWLHDKPTRWHKLGALIAFIGVIIIAIQKFQTSTVLGFCLVLIGAIGWATANVLIKLSQTKDMLRLMIWMSVVAPLPLYGLSVIFEPNQLDALINISWREIFAVLYMAIFPTIIAFALWGNLLKKYSPNVVAPFALLVPIFGFSLSALILNYEFTLLEFFASLLVLIGLAVIVMGDRIPKTTTNFDEIKAL